MSPRSASGGRPSRKPSAADSAERLQKVLASAGLGSRRHCEELILEGRVEVDGKIVNTLGSKASTESQEIRVDGVPIARPRRVYFVVNKPPGVVATNADPAGRARVIDLVGYTGRLFTVGRLDMSSEGLILVTNDGALAQRLAHPRYGVTKTYHVEVAGAIDSVQLAKLRKGIHSSEGVLRVVTAKVKRQFKHSTILEIVLAEGRNREIRRILARVGHKVERLKRVAIGPLKLAELPSGHVRELARDEVRKLKHLAKGTTATAPAATTATAPATRAATAPATRVATTAARRARPKPPRRMNSG